ncbi:AAA family ATPase, partial [bacterium]|nr:AAA family ATPase [bacterium]
MAKDKKYFKEQLSNGDSLFFENYYKKAANGLLNRTRDSLRPYFEFLEQAIKSEEKKGDYEISFRFIYQINLFSVTQRVFLDKLSNIFRIKYDFDLLKEEDNKFIYNSQSEIVKFNKSDCQKDGDFVIINNLRLLPYENEIIELKGDEVEFSIVKRESPKIEDILILNSNKVKIKNIEERSDKIVLDVDFEQTIKTIKLNDLEISHFEIELIKPNKLFDDDKEFEFEEEKGKYIVTSLPKSKKLKDENDCFYKWDKITNRKNQYKDSYFIQLIDDEEDESDFISKQISDYFFDDMIEEIYQGEKSENRIKIKSRIEKDKILELETKPIENKKIKMVVNVHNLIQQKKSIELLNRMPVLEYHHNLLKLFENFEKNKVWDDNTPKEINEWFILKNLDRNGTKEQRAFVKKAMGSKDFAILEGPPGSGKTTAIIELILQLIKDKKRVLLSASTHVAIDNVLERIKEYKEVIAIRVGDKNRISDSVKEFQLDNKKEQIKSGFKNSINDELLEQLILDSANLVCGTTMGIQQYPKIKNHIKDLPIYPEFDCLIIDESSKTTFQEFLVPALYAKKWILVGDIKQLSPYIEQTHIIHNLGIILSNEEKNGLKMAFKNFSRDKKNDDYKNSDDNKYVIELSSKEIKTYFDWY